MTFTIKTYKKLKARWEEAVENKEESFIFHEQEFDTNYAKYLLEYLKEELCA